MLTVQRFRPTGWKVILAVSTLIVVGYRVFFDCELVAIPDDQVVPAGAAGKRFCLPQAQQRSRP
jgi:hypothetical protein